MLRSKKLRISGFQWFVFPCSSFVVAYISVSRLLAVVNIRRSISAPRARNAKLHASVLESCCLPLLFFSTLFFFFFFLFFFFFPFFRLSLKLRLVHKHTTMMVFFFSCEYVRNVIVKHTMDEDGNGFQEFRHRATYRE